MSEAELDSAWSAYESAERERIRSVSLKRLRDLIRVFEASANGPRKAWAMDIARRSADGRLSTPVRMPLFREVLFPVLHDGVRHREPGCARWLATFAQYLYHSTDCLARLPEKHQTEDGLLREALDVDPDDTRARARLIEMMEYDLEYSLHELPHTVLYTGGAATVEECAELRAMLDDFERRVAAHGSRSEHEALIADCRFHFTAFAEYLADRASYDSYPAFLDETRSRG